MALNVRPWILRRALLAGLVGLAACGGSGNPSGSSAEDWSSGIDIARDARLLSPGPSDFVVLPCLGVSSEAPCAIVQAGGKSLLFGVPEGAHGALQSAGVAQPDGVFLFTIEGEGMEGLQRLRNQTWLTGRTSTLPVAGPDGTALMLAYLDKALEQADALSYVRHRPEGRFDTALFAPVDVDPSAPQLVFDSGDLSVLAVPGAISNVHYRILYDDRTLVLSSCPSQLPDGPELAALIFTCEISSDGRQNWPLALPGKTVPRTD